tara:strand:+ start:335 stop:859 length:525 start_codon:yes stop_codon:yes gene_type:complete
VKTPAERKKFMAHLETLVKEMKAEMRAMGSRVGDVQGKMNLLMLLQDVQTAPSFTPDDRHRALVLGEMLKLGKRSRGAGKELYVPSDEDRVETKKSLGKKSNGTQGSEKKGKTGGNLKLLITMKKKESDDEDYKSSGNESDLELSPDKFMAKKSGDWKITQMKALKQGILVCRK